MSDYLVELGQIRPAKKIARNFGIPIPCKLDRARGPWEDNPLFGQTFAVGGQGLLHSYIGKAVAGCGGELLVTSRESHVAHAYKDLKGATIDEEGDDKTKVNGLIFDATDLATPDQLSNLYEFFHSKIRGVKANGRVIVLGRPVNEQMTLSGASTSHALEGFIRSLAKELGRKGSTAHLIYVDSNEAAGMRLGSLLRFLLSKRSAFISGQIFRVTNRVRGMAEGSTTQTLANKVALVTGAARGIGAATAKALAAEGAQVVCLDRPQEEGVLSETALNLGGKILLHDISSYEAPAQIQKFFREEYGGVDIIVHNAGITRDKTLANMDASRWDSTIAVNLTAIIKITEALLEEGLNDQGRVVCLSSIAGIAGNFGQTNYAASKSGVIGFVEHLAEKVEDRGITVNAIAPGFIETQMTAAVPFLTREAGRRLSNVSQGGLPEDIANAVTYLASPGAVGVTGSVIRVCGGSLIGS